MVRRHSFCSKSPSQERAFFFQRISALLHYTLHLRPSPFVAHIRVAASSFQTACKVGKPVFLGAKGSTLGVGCGAEDSLGDSFWVLLLLLEYPPTDFFTSSHPISSGVQGTRACGSIRQAGQITITANVGFALPFLSLARDPGGNFFVRKSWYMQYKKIQISIR